MVIAADIDGVLASFESAWEPLLSRLAGGSKLPADWKTSPSFPPIWDWDKAAYGDEITREGWQEVGRSNRFWTTLDPMLNAKVECRRLNTLGATHDVFFITSRNGIGVKRQTEEWLYAQGVNYPTVLVVKRYQDKIPLLMDLGAEFFVDDKLETVQELYQHCYKNRLYIPHFYLKDAPYNRTERMKGLKVVDSLTEALNKAGL